MPTSKKLNKGLVKLTRENINEGRLGEKIKSISGSDKVLTKNELIKVSKYDYDSSPAPHFSEYVRRELEKVDSDLGINLYKDGLNIHTTLDSRIQSILTKAFDETMIKNQKIFNRDLLNNKERLEYVSRKSNISVDSLKVILKKH